RPISTEERQTLIRGTALKAWILVTKRAPEYEEARIFRNWIPVYGNLWAKGVILDATGAKLTSSFGHGGVERVEGVEKEGRDVANTYFVPLLLALASTLLSVQATA